MVGKVALVIPGSIGAIGGAAMRWRALHAALAPRGCEIHEIDCDRRGACHDNCPLTGLRHGPAGPPIWYHNRKFCPAYADNILRELVGRDVASVICSGLETYEYVRHWAASGTVNVVYDMHNVESQLYQTIGAVAPPGSIYATLFRPEHVAMVAAAEESAIRAATEVWCCTEPDRLLITATFRQIDQRKIRVVPNVVATDRAAVAPRREPTHVCFIGRLDHYPNLIAAQMLAAEVAPLLERLGCALPASWPAPACPRQGGGPFPATFASSRIRPTPQTSSGQRSRRQPTQGAGGVRGGDSGRLHREGCRRHRRSAWAALPTRGDPR